VLGPDFQHLDKASEDDVYDPPGCDRVDPNHAGVAVGYGKDSRGKDYW
jgi:hypothetical protein